MCVNLSSYLIMVVKIMNIHPTVPSISVETHCLSLKVRKYILLPSLYIHACLCNIATKYDLATSFTLCPLVIAFSKLASSS